MKIRIQPALYFYFATMMALTSWQTGAGAAAALFVHELGHIAACRLSGDMIDRIDLTPFGGMMTYAEGRTQNKGIRGICEAAAGPAANYLFLLLLGSMPELFERELLIALISSNAAMLCINLLPVLPLDGGRVLFCLGYYVFQTSRLISVLSWLGVAAGGGLIILSVYGIVKLGCLNCSVLIVGCYLIWCSRKSREQMLTDNLYTVLQEREENCRKIRRIKAYWIHGEIPLIRLVPLLGESYVCEFIYSNGEAECRLPESVLRRQILETPLLSVRAAFAQH